MPSLPLPTFPAGGWGLFPMSVLFPGLPSLALPICLPAPSHTSLVTFSYPGAAANLIFQLVPHHVAPAQPTLVCGLPPALFVQWSFSGPCAFCPLVCVFRFGGIIAPTVPAAACPGGNLGGTSLACPLTLPSPAVPGLVGRLAALHLQPCNLCGVTPLTPSFAPVPAAFCCPVAA